MRINQGQELVVGGYTIGSRNFDALVLGYYEEGKLLYASRTRNGFTPALPEQLSRKMKPLQTAECPFANLPEKKAGDDPSYSIGKTKSLLKPGNTQGGPN